MRKRVKKFAIFVMSILAMIMAAALALAFVIPVGLFVLAAIVADAVHPPPAEIKKPWMEEEARKSR